MCPAYPMKCHYSSLQRNWLIGQHRRCHYGSRIRRVVNTQSPRRSSLKQHPQDRCVTTHKGVLDRTDALLIPALPFSWYARATLLPRRSFVVEVL